MPSLPGSNPREVHRPGAGGGLEEGRRGGVHVLLGDSVRTTDDVLYEEKSVVSCGWVLLFLVFGSRDWFGGFAFVWSSFVFFVLLFLGEQNILGFPFFCALLLFLEKNLYLLGI